jgi:hypothetical protein
MPAKTIKRRNWKIFYSTVFAAAMGYLESAVVIYLRRLYYPDGFSFPLKLIPQEIGFVEIGREAATIFMLLAVAAVSSRRFWERFGFFIYLFGVWDIMYYFWLKLLVNWPADIFDWDILFLIPAPWAGPVAAPILISLLMIIVGLYITSRFAKGETIKPSISEWILALVGAASMLFTFLENYKDILNGGAPQKFNYWLFFLGLGFAITSFALLIIRRNKEIR